MIKRDDLLYVPRNVENINKTRIFMIVVWSIISFSYFMWVNFPNVFRSAYPMYLLGSMPMMIAFSDKDYISTYLKSEFVSLRCALYKGNVIWMVIYIISLFFSIDDIDEIFIRICSVLVFWFLSIILVVTYNIKKWIMIFLCIIFISGTFLYWLRNVFALGNISYMIPIIFVISVLLISILITGKLVEKF